MRICDICEKQARRHTCNGDGGNHHHGQVHTILRGSTNDLVDLCDEHYAEDRDAWERAGSRGATR